MKRTFFFLVLAGLLAANVFAQKAIPGLADRLKVNSVADPFLTRDISAAFDLFNPANAEAIKEITGIPSFRKQDFDLSNLYQGSVQGGSEVAIVAPYKGPTGYESFGFVIFRHPSGYVKPMLIKTYPDRSLLVYYDLEEGLTLTIERNGKQFSYRTSATDFGVTKRQAGRGGCRQPITDCIIDAYSNHGWSSVWTMFQSAFIPTTAAAIIGACVTKNCSF